MKEIIRFWLLKRVVKNTELTAEIYQMLYNYKTFVRTIPPPAPKLSLELPKPVLSSVQINPTTLNPKSNDRRSELVSALRELESKTLKTKQDKDSIGIIKAALKNVN